MLPIYDIGKDKNILCSFMVYSCYYYLFG